MRAGDGSDAAYGSSVSGTADNGEVRERKASRVGLSDVLYGVYERRLAHDLDRSNVPRHVGVMLDGNRRWAKANGFDTVGGHQAGADKIQDLLA